MTIEIGVPGGAVVLETWAELDPIALRMLICQVHATHKVPILPDGVKVRFERAR